MLGMDLSFLSDLLRVFADAIPRPVMVRTDERLVEFRFGRWPRVLGPGWYLEIPLIATYESHFVTDQFVENQQRFGHNVYRYSVRFAITDALLFATRTYDDASLVADVTEIQFSQALLEHDSDLEQISKAVHEAIKEELKEFGIDVRNFQISGHSKADFCLSVWELSQ